MKRRTWPILSVAFGTLVALIALSGLGALQRARQLYAEVSTLHDGYLNMQRVLNEVRTEIHLSELLVRDFLLDPTYIAAGYYRQELVRLRSSMSGELEELKRMLGNQQAPEIQSLAAELDEYWKTLEPLFEWTPAQKIALSSTFLRRNVLPRRNAVLALAGELRDLNRENLEAQQHEIDRKQKELPAYVGSMVGATILLGLLVAAATIYRTHRLESRSESERQRAESAEQELRRLSQQLVQAQEDERRTISRELHDEVGQMLTALRMELRNLNELRTAAPDQFQDRLADAKRLSEQALRVVRDLAMGLRPSMLDDLGLGPALEWQAREFSRRSGVPVTVQLEGALDSLPDLHRTCVYRVVQEALTNCARHSRAKSIRIAVHGHQDGLSMTIQDDGVGFDPARTRGLGLVGVEERVRELGGKVAIFSQPNKGTVVSVEVPVHSEAATA